MDLNVSRKFSLLYFSQDFVVCSLQGSGRFLYISQRLFLFRCLHGVWNFIHHEPSSSMFTSVFLCMMYQRMFSRSSIVSGVSSSIVMYLQHVASQSRQVRSL